MTKLRICTGHILTVLLCTCGILNAAEPAANYFNVRDYGAVGDGKNLDSPAIDKAITAAADVGARRNLFERFDSSEEQHPSRN
jgi:Pectate lyase superfamily protein